MSSRGSPLSGPEPLSPDHGCVGFESGNGDLDVWLRRFALSNQRAEYTRTYVVHRELRVVGYYALAMGSVEPAAAPSRVRAGAAARLPIPVVLLARLAVDRTEQGSGLGRALLKDALLRVAGAADIAGARALLVDAQDERARAFYERFNFEQLPVDPLQMFLLMKDLRRVL